MPDLITPKEAAEMLSIKPDKLAAMRFHWRGPPFYKLGGAVLYDKKELLKWFHDGRRAPPKTPQQPNNYFSKGRKTSRNRKAVAARNHNADEHATA
jgi:hypothetical protein